MYKIEEITNKSIWESFLSRKEQTFYPFFQSWSWGEVEKKLGSFILRLGLYEKRAKKLVGVCLAIEVRAKRGTYFHLRHGPVLLSFDQKTLNPLLSYVEKIALKRGVSFIRISPLLGKNYRLNTLLKNRKFVNAPIHNMDAQICWLLNIEKPEIQLLKDMRKTHRYIIKKSESLNIKIIRTEKVSEIDSFLRIYIDLSKRKHFFPHKGLREEFDEFAKEKSAVLYLAQYKDTVIAGAIIVYAGNMAIYRHGASLEAYKHIPASYCIQWRAIKDAQEKGLEIYNFWGISPSDKKNHPWVGLTLFKTGFGGEMREFIHAKDFPLSLWYLKTYCIEYIAKLWRGY